MTRLLLFSLSLFVLLPGLAIAQDSLDLTPYAANVSVGKRVELALDASFTSSVLGGEVGIEYDPAVLHLSEVNWNSGYADDPLLRCPSGTTVIGGRGCPGKRAFVAMGSLDGLPDGTVATLVFDTVGPGETTVRLDPTAPFSGLFGESLGVTHGKSEVIVVPEPNIVAALSVGAFGLVGLSRRRTRERRARGDDGAV